MPAKTDRQLLEDVSGALVRAVLKGEHRLVALYLNFHLSEQVAIITSISTGFPYVEAREIRPIRVEGLVVEVDELL